MDTRTTKPLTDISIQALQLSSNKNKQEKPNPPPPVHSSSIASPLVKQELSSSIPPHSASTCNPTIPLLPIMSDSDDIIALKELQHQQLKLEQKFLSTIPVFKSPFESNIDAFLSIADEIFAQLKYTDAVRIQTIGDKLDVSLQPWFTHFTHSHPMIWNDFKKELPNCLQPFSKSELIHNDKSCTDDIPSSIERNDKPTLLELLRLHLTPFSGDSNARQWFIQTHTKFSALDLSSHDCLEILPYFLLGESIVWFSLNKDKMKSYADFCQLFTSEYLSSTKSQSSYSSIINDEIKADGSTNKLTQTPSSLFDPNVPSSDSTNLSSTSKLSSTISKALIDRFVKDPIKFYGGKDSVITWLEEIDQQFKIMNLTDPDKLSLIHICLKGEAYQWYKQNQLQFLSWSIFVNEITTAHTSHFQRDLAFTKLKLFHQTVRQSVTQYYTEMIKLMKQADPQMNESTKVQYLMNGLRASLSTETRRNYPKSTQEFLAQAKIAEDLTALNTIFASAATLPDDSVSPNSFPYFQATDPTAHSTPTNEFKNYSHQSNINHHYDNKDYSPQDNNQPRYVNHISKPPFTSSQSQPPFNSSRQSSPSTNIPPLLNNQTYWNPTTKNNQQQSFQRCFKCGGLDHIARNCHHFAKGGQ